MRTTAVFDYDGGIGPREGVALVDRQMALADVYYNDLIELELSMRKRVRVAMNKVPELAVLQAERVELGKLLEVTRETINQIKQRRRKEIATPLQDARAHEYRRVLKELSLKIKEAKGRVALLVKPELDRINLEHAQEVRDARARIRREGLYWGTYLIVEEAVERASEATMDPEPRSFSHKGHIAVQFQGGLSVEELFACEGRLLRIAPVPADTWTTKRKRDQQGETWAWFRVGSTEVGQPVWTKFRVRLHRPLPPGGIIKWAHFLRVVDGTRWRWKLQLTVEFEIASERVPASSADAIAVDLGWRSMPEGIRVGYFVDSDGAAGQVLVDDERVTKAGYTLLSALTKADSLRAIRDRDLESVRPWLATWLREHIDELPGSLVEDALTVSAWRSPRRLVGFVKRWGRMRIPGDELVYALALKWRLSDDHLWQWEVNQRSEVYGRRRDYYRCIGAKWAAKYAALVLEDLDLRPLAETPRPEEEDESQPNARHGRWLAAPSEFRSMIKNAFVMRGRKVFEEPAFDTTRKCHVCAVIARRTDALMQRCECGARWDQDYNAAVNLLRLANGKVKALRAGELEESKSRESRWSRRKREKGERLGEAEVGGSPMEAQGPGTDEEK